MNDYFNVIRDKVLEIIDLNNDKEITKSTANTNSGIYMLYVDDFSDDTIIPFYIGQTSNFQKRYKAHLKELLTLNRLSCECYRQYLINNVYEGYYKACKIFTYLINHNCSFDNFHMIVIETIDDEQNRLGKEDFYINNLYASFFGFNQLNSISKHKYYNYSSLKKKEFTNIISKDIENLLLYSQYGYCNFNFFLARGVLKESEKFELLLNNEEYSKLLNDGDELKFINEQMTKISQYDNNGSKELLRKTASNDIESYFLNNNLKSKDKQEDIIDVLLFNDEQKKRQVDNYIQRFAQVEKIDICDYLYKKHESVIKKIKQTLLENHEKYHSYRKDKAVLFAGIIESLLPNKEYTSHPLKDMYKEFCFNDTYKENTCCINIEFTCLKSTFHFIHDFHPEIYKIDYKFMKDGKEITKSTFIKNSLISFFDEGWFYVEKRFFDEPYNWFSEPFSLVLQGNVGTHIPVSMEYRNGINEYTFKNKIFENEFDVFQEIDTLIDDKTKIIYTTSGYKSAIQRYSELIERTPNGLLKKLIQASKR